MFQFTGFPLQSYGFTLQWQAFTPAGFPHSDICGSMLICSSPQLFAACHVLLRLLMPRHSPYALLSLNSFVYQSIYCSLNCCVPRFLQLLFASAKIAFTLFGKTWFLHLLFPLLFKKPVRVCFFLLIRFSMNSRFLCGQPLLHGFKNIWIPSNAFETL